MRLAIDIGNSRTQLRIYDHVQADQLGQLGQERPPSGPGQYELPSVDLTGDCPGWSLVEAWWADLPVELRPKSAVLLSVVPAAAEQLTTRLVTQLGVVTHQVTIDDPFALDIAYATPQTLGLDRLVAASAAFHRYAKGRAVVVVDCGTATTVDAVTSTGKFLGGAIAPGLATAAHALIEKGAQLPAHRFELPPRAIGDSTELCLRSGVMLGHAALIEGLAQRMAEGLGEASCVVATGGWATALRPALRGIDYFDPDLLPWGACALLARIENGPSPA